MAFLGLAAAVAWPEKEKRAVAARRAAGLEMRWCMLVVEGW